MGAHHARTTSATRSRLGGTMLLLGASVAVAGSLAPSALADPGIGSHGGADGGTVTGGSAGNATTHNAQGAEGGDGGQGGAGGQGGQYDYQEQQAPATSTGLLGTSLLPATTTGTTYYANCTDARNQGVQNIPRGAPGYRAALDGDGDGVACENPGNGRD